jgi:hypothetical protein
LGPLRPGLTCESVAGPAAIVATTMSGSAKFGPLIDTVLKMIIIGIVVRSIGEIPQ